MKPEHDDTAKAGEPREKESDRCDLCGAPEAYPIAGRILCADCQIEAGSACGGTPTPRKPPVC
jgi:hypothetical protein